MKAISYSIIFLLLPLFSFGQCFTPDSTIWLNPWETCTKTTNPNKLRGDSHWLSYDFGSERNLSRTWVWNANDPQKLDQGFKQVVIDYSVDGEVWIEWGEMNFPKGTAEAIYGGFPGPDLVGIKAQFVLITVLSTYGDGACASLAEIKFNLLPGEANGDGECLVNPATNVKVFNIAETSAEIYWENPAGCDVECQTWLEYRKVDETEWTKVFEEPIFSLADLLSGTVYEYRVGTQKDCDPSNIVYTKTEFFKTLGISNVETPFELKSLKVYPNPSQNYFYVLGDINQAIKFEILNSVGQKLKEGTLDNRSYLIDLSEFSSGIYYLNFYNQVHKLVKL